MAWHAKTSPPPVIAGPAAQWPHRPRGRRLWVGTGLALLALTLAVVLFRFDPAQATFYPRCVFHQVTGWHCPGCGSLRALHQLLHGRFLEALRLNPFVVLALPALGWLVGRLLWGETLARKLPAVGLRRAWLLAGVAALALYGVLRNLPWTPFTVLAP